MMIHTHAFNPFRRALVAAALWFLVPKGCLYTYAPWTGVSDNIRSYYITILKVFRYCITNQKKFRPTTKPPLNWRKGDQTLSLCTKGLQQLKWCLFNKNINKRVCVCVCACVRACTCTHVLFFCLQVVCKCARLINAQVLFK